MFSKSVGPYCGVLLDRKRKFSSGHELRFVLYRAYNAMGLIGSECNGIAILSETDSRVVCDEMNRALSGYDMPTTAQLCMFEHLLSDPDDEVQDYIESHKRTRYTPKLC